MPRIWVFSAGVSAYDDGHLSLKFAEDDARAVDELFGSAEGGAIPPERRTFLPSKRTTRAELLGELHRLMQRTTRDDEVIVFLSMHGVRSEGTFYLLGREARLDNLPGTGISREDLHRAVAGAEAKRIVLLVDTCNSGSVGFADFKDADLGVDAESVRQILSSDGVGVLSSSGAGERSREDERIGHGIFTHYLLRGIRGEADGASNQKRDGIVTLRELYDYVYSRVRDDSRNQQHPELKGADTLPVVAFSRPSLAVTPASAKEPSHNEQLRSRNDSLRAGARGTAIVASPPPPTPAPQALYYEDFRNVDEHRAPSTWLGTESYETRRTANGSASFGCFKSGPARFTVPLPQVLPPKYRIELVFTRQDRFDEAKVEAGALRAGFAWNEAFINDARQPDGAGTRLAVGSPLVLQIDRNGDVATLFVDGRQLVGGRFAAGADAQQMTVTFTRNQGLRLDCPGAPVMHRLAVQSR
jgi:uncharacterized caspase-like protein